MWTHSFLINVFSYILYVQLLLRDWLQIYDLLPNVISRNFPHNVPSCNSFRNVTYCILILILYGLVSFSVADRNWTGGNRAFIAETINHDKRMYNCNATSIPIAFHLVGIIAYQPKIRLF